MVSYRKLLAYGSALIIYPLAGTIVAKSKLSWSRMRKKFLYDSDHKCSSVFEQRNHITFLSD